MSDLEIIFWSDLIDEAIIPERPRIPNYITCGEYTIGSPFGDYLTFTDFNAYCEGLTGNLTEILTADTEE